MPSWVASRQASSGSGRQRVANGRSAEREHHPRLSRVHQWPRDVLRDAEADIKSDLKKDRDGRMEVDDVGACDELRRLDGEPIDAERQIREDGPPAAIGDK